MYKLLVSLSLFALLVGPVFSASISFDTEGDITFTSLASNTNDLVTEYNSGTSDNPALLYVPVNKQGNQQQAQNVLGTDLPELANGTVSAGQTFNIKFNIDLDTGDAAQYVYIAWEKDDNDYVILKEFAQVTGDVDDVVYQVDLGDVCNATYFKDCTVLATVNSGNNESEEDVFYIFTSDTQYSLYDDQDFPTVEDNGIYLEMKWSNRYYTGTEDSGLVTPSISQVVTGDGSLYIDYTSDAAFPDEKELIVMSYGSAQATILDYATATAVANSTIISDENEFPIDDGGARIQVKDLVNNQVYNLAVAFVDKYQFTSQFSVSQQGIPLEIAKFLNEQSCYLVSAGFGRPHYVLNYFRMIRDRYLLRTEIGKAFVELYYSTAPKYAGYIYKNKVLAAVVRGASYVLYFSLKYFWVLTLMAFGILYLTRFFLCNSVKKQ